MSHPLEVDSEIELLRLRLTMLEEKKQFEQKKRENPLNKLKDILDITKTQLETPTNVHTHSYTIRGDTQVKRGTPLTVLAYERDKLEMLELIHMLFDKIQKRLDALERFIC
jgi:hypothetical protein